MGSFAWPPVIPYIAPPDRGIHNGEPRAYPFEGEPRVNSTPRMGHLVAATAAVFLVAFTASGARIWIPDLRAKTRAPAQRTSEDAAVAKSSLTVVRLSTIGFSPRHDAVRVAAAPVLERPSIPRPVTNVTAPRTLLGVGPLKGRRLLGIGGHGRHGAG